MIPEYRIDHLRRALGHRYTFEAFLGRGAFATVLLVRNVKLGRREALKVLQESYDGDHEFAKRFVEEAKLVASLDHPNIVKVYDYGEVDGVLWYSMHYISGPSLGAELEARRPLEQQEVVSLAVPLLDALSYSHLAGVVHRDVKPGNIMISMRGRPYLMDFGIAKVKDGGFKTATGSVLGTPAYISPEQAAGENVDGRSDVYSLGVCLYQLLTGSLPFPAPDPVRMLLRRLIDDPEPLSALLPTVDPELEAIVLKSLARLRGDRFQSAAEMRDRLLAAFPHQVDLTAVRVTAKIEEPAPLNAPPTPPEILDPSEAPTITKRATKPARRRSRLPLLAAVGVIAFLAISWWFFLASRDGEPPPPSHSASKPSPATARVKAPRKNPPASSDVAELESATAVAATPTDSEENAEPTAPPAPSDIAPSDTAPSDANSSETRERNPPPTAPPPPRPRQAIVPPAILEAPSIELDAETAAECSSQEVILTASIDAAGELISSRALVSTSEACKTAALEHMKRYRFRPGRDFENQPVTSRLTLSIQFP